MEVRTLGAAEAELDRFIDRRASEAKSGTQRTEEMAWKASVRRYNAARHKEIRAEWFAFFSRQAEAHRKLSEDYERRAEALCEDRGEGRS